MRKITIKELKKEMGEKIIGVKYKNSPGDQTTFEIVSVGDDGIRGKSNLTNEIFSGPDGSPVYLVE